MEQITNEIKTRSIRADNESFEKFKTISEEFPNQAQALQALLTVYEIEKSKAIIPERKTEIETFETYVKKLNELYNNSLMLNHDAEIRIRNEFERLLNSKDTTIQELQDKIKNLDYIKKEHLELTRTIDNLNRELTTTIQEKDKIDGLTNSLTSTITNYQRQINENNEQLKLNENLQQEIFKLKSDNDNLNITNKKLQEQINTEIEKSNIAKDKALLEADKLYNKQLNELHESYQNQMKNILFDYNKKEVEETKQSVTKKTAPKSTAAKQKATQNSI